MIPCKVIFMGTPELARTVLEKLIASKTYAPTLVITQPDKPVGRKRERTPPPVKRSAETHGIPVLQPQKMKDPELIARITAEKPDVIVVAAYGKIIPKEIIAIPRRGILNVHTSLLPKYRGASPAQHAILSGDTETGATIMLIDEGLDTGPIVSQRHVAIDPADTAETLLQKLAICGGELLLKTLPGWCSGETRAHAQDDAHATLAPMLTKEDGEIRSEYPAEHIERMIRAFTPWPGTYIKLAMSGMTLKIIAARITLCDEQKPPLVLSLSARKELILHTVKGCLALETVQPEGKKPMEGYAFYLGYQAQMK